MERKDLRHFGGRGEDDPGRHQEKEDDVQEDDAEEKSGSHQPLSHLLGAGRGLGEGNFRIGGHRDLPAMRGKAEPARQLSPAHKIAHATIAAQTQIEESDPGPDMAPRSPLRRICPPQEFRQKNRNSILHPHLLLPRFQGMLDGSYESRRHWL
jgi:hypothetical protein